MLNRFAIALMFATWAAHAAAPLDLESNQGMVVTSHLLSSDVGAAILRQGGNAVDAAVAVGYALAVTHPCCGNLGGGGFMTIYMDASRCAKSLSCDDRQIRLQVYIRPVLQAA